MFYRTLQKELEKWKESSHRKPLIIRGARQVGKTTLVHTFGQQFKHYIYLNLEKEKDAQLFSKYDEVEELITRLFIQKRIPKKDISETLLFIDEIQEIPKAINQLRYFKEELPELPVIAAGSMLESLLGKSIAFPVGRVEFRVLRPFSFEEYLIAMKEDMLIELYHKTPIDKYAIPVLLEAFNTYTLIGGMPEIIAHYATHRDITALPTIYDGLLNSYLQDAEKYAKNDERHQLIRFSIQQAIMKAGQRITYQRFGNSNFSSQAVGIVLRALEKTHLIHIMHPVTRPILPLEPDYKKTPRIQFLDTGMMNYFVDIQKNIIGEKDLCKVYQGTMIEHLVGQELLSILTLSLKKIHFWVRQKKQSDAEIDYIYSYDGKLIPIEVKSGATGTLKSLHVYMDIAPINVAIRFYAGEIQLSEMSTPNGKNYHLLSLPYFLVRKIESYLEWLDDKIGIQYISPQQFNEAPEPYKKITKQTQQDWNLTDLNKKHISVLNYCKTSPKKGKEILENALGLSYQSTNKRKYIKPLMDLGLIEFTIKNYEKSKNQRYQLTEKGKKMVE